MFVQELQKYKNSNRGSVKGFSGAKEAGPEVLFEKCDILVLAAFEKTINHENASKLNCKVKQRMFLYHNLNLGKLNYGGVKLSYIVGKIFTY